MILQILNLIIAVKIPYYYNPQIHNFGNIGLGGHIHAQIAPFATRTIDKLCYDSRDVRSEIYNSLNNNNILDLCCGIGMSTIPGGIGIDTSREMLNVARKITNNKNQDTQFFFGNAETYKPDFEVEHVTCMFAFHEMPLYAQKNILENAISIANKTVIIVDISPIYTPSKTMLSGEPYILDYLSNIKNLMMEYNFMEIEYISGHVSLWIYNKI